MKKETNMGGNMTRISITKDAKEGYMMIEVDGHHEEPHVCSAISAIMQTTELGLIALSNSVNNVTISINDNAFHDEEGNWEE